MSNTLTLQPGETGTAEIMVTQADLASNLSNDPSDNFPDVYATSRMIALMELAAARLMKKILQPGQLSVGVNVNVMHLAATPNQVPVSATATFLGMEGKLFKFKVEASDPGGLIGNGEHTRAVIDTERLLAGANKKLGK